MSWNCRALVQTATLLVALCAAPLRAHEEDGAADAPDTLAGTTKVDAEGLIETLARVPDLVIIDSRIAMDRQQGYIEGSVSLPDTATDCDSLSVLLEGRSAPILFYCNGPKCGRSVKAIHKAQECGYDRIFWFRGGFEEWATKGYPFLKE